MIPIEYFSVNVEKLNHSDRTEQEIKRQCFNIKSMWWDVIFETVENRPYWDNAIKSTYPWGRYLGDRLMNKSYYDTFYLPYNVWYKSSLNPKFNAKCVIEFNMFVGLENDYPEIGA